MTDVKPIKKQTASAHNPVNKATKKATDAAGKGRKGGTGTAVGVAAGVVAGAAIGGIAGAVLSDEKKRKEAGKHISNIAKTAGDTVNKLEENKGELKKAAHTLKDTAEPVQKTGKSRN